MDRSNAHLLRRGRFSEPGRLYLLTSVVENRHPVFSDFQIARLMVEQLQYAQHQRLAKSLAWVLMPDHLHWLIELQHGTLASLMRRIKSRSTCLVNKTFHRKGRLWQHGFHDRALRKDEDVQAVARYIVANPLRAGLVQNIGDYPHWDAIWL
ncbi:MULTISPECIES: transposase [Pseudomonas]|jgi:putative transposase|uniref:REP-associated tyrosine transposase n=1 Tax=Pseudomonas TaxID=286 RepID=UPI00073091FA|nr:MULTISPECIES: transposase [Pseudomonas]KTC20025.1 transposase [Pseudomonas putida]MCO7503880.1 transposase [Pseudomonas sp. VE 267-6A]MCO7530301.1 transposase [Pseudomonas sp. 2]WEJ21873.1 transposase [Pseudomonas sp. SD17-1]WKL67712.1 transposase [Pseudomonas qingdaonensis]